MIQAELLTVLKSTGLPVAYGSFLSVVSPPFITYQFAYNKDLMADNINYAEIANFQVELYTTKKDLASEKNVQDALKGSELPYSKIETWIDEEKMFQILYEIQLIGG